MSTTNQTTQTQATQPDQTTTNQQNQTQANSTPTFDVNNLPPEFQRYVDQQRTQASQTARANAREQLMHDESFLNEVRTGMTGQVQQTVEEQLAELRRETQIDRSSAKVERILSPVIADDSDRELYISMLVSEDVEASVQRANDFVAVFNKSVENGVNARTKSQMNNMTTPQTSNTTVSDQDRLQSQLDAVKKEIGQPAKKAAKISAIMREAQEKNIILK